MSVTLDVTMAGPEFDFDMSELLELFTNDHNGRGKQQTVDAAVTMGASLAQQQPVLQMTLTATATVMVPPPMAALAQMLLTRQTALVNKNNQKTETKMTAASKPPPPPPATTAVAIKQPSKPRQPLSAYNLFFKHERARLLTLIERGKSPPPIPPPFTSPHPRYTISLIHWAIPITSITRSDVTAAHTAR